MNPNKKFTLAVTLLVICIAVIVRQSFKVQNLNHQLERTVRDLRKKDKQLELKGDSIKIMVRKNADLDTLWSGIVKDQLKAIEQERLKTKQATVRYEKLKNSPAVHYPEHELDSVISSIIKRRQH